MVHTSLQENVGGSSDEWETVDLQGIDMESNNSNDGNSYHHQILGVNAEDIPPKSIKEVIVGLSVPTIFREEGWTKKKASLKSKLLLKCIKLLQCQGIIVHTQRIHID